MVRIDFVMKDIKEAKKALIVENFEESNYALVEIEKVGFVVFNNYKLVSQGIVVLIFKRKIGAIDVLGSKVLDFL